MGGLRCHVQSGRNRLNRRNGTAAPHRRAAAPPHRRTLAPLHLQVFLSGPRKYCSGILTNGLGRALLGFTHWGCILLTIGLCFILVNANLIIFCIVVQKLFWALNLAASCGCLCTAATASSTDKSSGARAQKAGGRKPGIRQRLRY